MKSSELKDALRKARIDAGGLINSYTAVSLIVRHAPDQHIRDLVSANDGGSIEAVIQLLRIDLASLDRALALVSDEILIRARRLPADEKPAAGGALN
jgi:hypothetical protein